MLYFLFKIVAAFLVQLDLKTPVSKYSGASEPANLADEGELAHQNLLVVRREYKSNVEVTL